VAPAAAGATLRSAATGVVIVGGMSVRQSFPSCILTTQVRAVGVRRFFVRDPNGAIVNVLSHAQQ